MGVHPSKDLIIAALSDGKPKSHREIMKVTGLTRSAVWSALNRYWVQGLLLRTKRPIYESERIFKGRGGVSRTTRPFHLYVINPEGVDSLRLKYEFVKYEKEHLDARGGRGESKASLILNFLKENSGKAWFSNEIARTLKANNIQSCDVMACVRRYERKGLLYVRGYRSDFGQTPFRDGYLITWIDQNKPREQALDEAIQRTETALGQKASTHPIMQRIHLIKDLIFEASKLRELTSFEYMKSKLDCSEHEVEGALSRAIQLYPDLKEIKLFNAYRYYYHASMPEDDLKAAIAMKENYIRIIKGRANRIGHNWEAVIEHFIDTLTTGAKFWTQTHRTKVMDPRRITIHLTKPVGHRRSNAEVDRIWEVTPGPLLKPTTYVLECKWGLVRKEDVDDFFEVLRWSKEFGVDTPEGRQVKQGIVGVFAGSAFNPKENVRLKDETEISLATYAARMNIQLLKASDFNDKLRERGCSKTVTVQKICRVARDEKEVREVLESIWENPGKSDEILIKTIEKNKEVYEFEKMLEEKGKS